MKGNVRLLGKSFPAWIVAVALIIGTAGAATGIVLSGQVTGEFTATSSQALLIDTTGSGISGPVDAALFTRSDDGTKFTAGAQVNQGDAYNIRIALANESAVELTGELVLFGPHGITVSVAPADAIVDQDGDLVPDALVQTGPFNWKFRMNPEPLGSGGHELDITVALPDDLPPGFYAIDGTIKQVAQ